MRKVTRIVIKNIVVFVVISAWLLTGWPAFWITPQFRFPPEITQVHAATTQVFLTTADTSPWTVPNNWGGMVSIEVIGGGKGGTNGGNGANGGAGGDGGGYAKITTGFTTTAGSQISFQVGTGSAGGATPSNGGDTWFNSTGTVLANGGGSGTSRVGSVNWAGGAGGTASNKGGGGGGGAAGPTKTTTGVGKDGGSSGASALGGGGGGGSEGDSATVGSSTTGSTFGTGGNGWNGTGGGSTAGAAGTAGTGGGGAGSSGDTTTTGGAGATGTNIDASHGSGGGGGGGGGTATKNSSNSGAGGNGGLYGGGGGGSGGTNNRQAKTAGNGEGGLIVITYTIDDVAPTPNPMTFGTNPNNDAAGQISMAATQASDNFVAQSAISYLFTNDNSTCTYPGNGGTNSSWQLNNLNYTDTGLDPNKCYGYYIQAKDTAGNTTSTTTPTTTYSSAAVPSAPTVDTPTSSTLHITNNENGNPTSNPVTLFAATVISTSPLDSTWDGKWINSSGNPVTSEAWLTDAQLTETINGLQPSTTYNIQVKAKNEDGDITALSATGSGTTSSGNQAPTAPTNLYANERAAGAQSGVLNPVALGDGTPVFSAEYTDPDTNDVADFYEVIVYSDAACTSQLWDSTQTALTPCTEPNRCMDITYGGSALPFDGNQYSWKIRYWDTGGLQGALSACNTFTELGPANQMRHGNYFFNNTTERVFTW